VSGAFQIAKVEDLFIVLGIGVTLILGIVFLLQLIHKVKDVLI